MTTNNFKPILFSTEMVQAILAGRKTQTRRVLGYSGTCMKCGCTDNDCARCIEKQNSPCYWVDAEHLLCSRCENEGKNINTKYQLGDILWVRETFRELINCETKEFAAYDYKADMPEEFHKQFPHKWKPSLFMPKEAARIFLKVTNVRAERLQDISEEDAIAEGVEGLKKDGYRNYLGIGSVCAEVSFETLWNSINAKKQPWDSNPWVWVYEFERIEKPENFLS